MNVAIIGSRTFTDYNYLESKLYPVKDRITCIISGGAKGADKLSEMFANKYNIPIRIFKPDYDKYPPKIAPIMRNTTIIEKCNIVIAFWDGKSRGTLDAINKAKKLNKKIKIYEIENS